MGMPRIVILDAHTVNPGDNSWDALEALGDLRIYPRTPSELTLERARDADILVTNKTELDAGTLAALPRLKGVCVLATGYDVVDVQAAKTRAIPVCNVPGYSTASVVEHTFALILELCRGVGVHAAAVREGEWTRAPDFTFWKTPQRELSQRVLGIVGYGSIGRAVARVGAALGMAVLATPSRSKKPEADVTVLELDQLFAQADVISLHCPLTPDTRELVNGERLSKVKSSALLVNTARGALIQEAELARALLEGRLAGAALDVLTEEPPAKDNPLLSAPRCIITPHVAWTTLEARRRLVQITAENVAALIAGRPLRVVNR